MKARIIKKLVALLAIAILVISGMAPSLMQQHNCMACQSQSCLYCRVIAEGVKQQTNLFPAPAMLMAFAIFAAMGYVRKGSLDSFIYMLTPVAIKVRMND